MTDAELIARLRSVLTFKDLRLCPTAADRIEQLVVTNEALQKALKDQSSVSDRLAEQLATCEKYRDAYAEMDRIGTQAVRDLEAKLAKAVAALGLIVVDNTWGLEHETYMKCRTTLAEIKGESHE